MIITTPERPLWRRGRCYVSPESDDNRDTGHHQRKSTTSAQTYNENADRGSHHLTGTTLTFGGTVKGNDARDLTLAFSGTTTITDATFVETTTERIRNLTFSGATATVSLAGTIETTGTQTYNGTVTLSGATTLTSTGSGVAGSIAFSKTVDGGGSLQINSGGTTVFTAPVGNTTALASLATDSAGDTSINGGLIKTVGAQTYQDRVTLGATTLMTSTERGTSDCCPRSTFALDQHGGDHDLGRRSGRRQAVASLVTNVGRGRRSAAGRYDDGQSDLRGRGDVSTAA